VGVRYRDSNSDLQQFNDTQVTIVVEIFENSSLVTNTSRQEFRVCSLQFCPPGRSYGQTVGYDVDKHWRGPDKLPPSRAQCAVRVFFGTKCISVLNAQ
jgi:hypothetical protein